ncbi:MAG: thiamine pyrophosphate-binding protein [Deltaproteobacteria bacterium]|nr:thiamine pyrophosphate-binding protein [Deltaproteobacteria bacterium]
MTQVVGGDALAQMLAAEGVEVVFGIVDGTYMGFFASFEKHGIRLITPRHETSAAHMAGAYARLTGKLGVCMASNGPGVANILPGVAVENGEGNRVLLVTSCRRTPIAYPDRGGTYQYFDQTGVTRAMTKWSGAVPSFERLPELFRRAARISWSGRPGVVHLDVPETIMNGVFEAEGLDLRPPEAYRRTAAIEPSASQVTQAAELLRNAERPHIHAGSGVLHARASSALEEVATALGAPVTTSWAGRGALADNHEQLLPIWAMEPIKKARSEADVMLVLGSRLGETDWWGKPPYWGKPDEQEMIQVDIDDEILGLNKATELAVLADAGAFLSALASELRQSPLSDQRLQTNRARTASLGPKSALNSTKRCKTRGAQCTARRYRPRADAFSATTQSTCSTAAMRQCGRVSSPRSTSPTRCFRPSSWACWVQGYLRLSAGKSPSLTQESCASSAMARWAFTSKSSKPHSAMTFPSSTSCSATSSGAW